MNEADALYLRQMQEISVRFASMNRIIEARKPNNVRTELDNEFLWLQLRMVVELVAFSGITADQERYASLRAEVLNNPDYTRDGKVNKILPALAKISPHFLPIPISNQATKDEAGSLHLERGSEAAELSRFIEIHERAGEHLHTDNPFSPSKRSESIERLSTSRERFLADYAYVWGVLKVHAKVCLEFDCTVDKPTQPANAERVWLVQFDAPKKGHVSMLIGQAVFNPASDSEGSTI
jgi:hypothetical protein